jgi:hypothetical protein
MSDLELYISQNSNPDVQRSRQIRMALRALDGQRVTWPYVHTYVSSDVGLPYKALPFFCIAHWSTLSLVLRRQTIQSTDISAIQASCLAHKKLWRYDVAGSAARKWSGYRVNI